MEAYIVVSPTPYFAQTDKSGTYKIDNVPDGSYTVTAWNEGANGQSKPVTVSGDSTADFTLTKIVTVGHWGEGGLRRPFFNSFAYRFCVTKSCFIPYHKFSTGLREPIKNFQIKWFGKVQDSKPTDSNNIEGFTAQNGTGATREMGES
jgi:hypothetical protein